MHTFQPRWPEGDPDWEPPEPVETRFRDACDLVTYSELEPLTTWYTYPIVWHLDDEGRWRCGSKGSSFESVRVYAEEPERLLMCRRVRVKPRCPDNWVILESRHPYRPDRYEVCEDDARAFVTLRNRLAFMDIALLDVVVFDQDRHWWSLNELTTGTTAWTFPPPRDGRQR